MSDERLPAGWNIPDRSQTARLKRQFLSELEAEHPLHRMGFEVVGVRAGDDTVVVAACEPGLPFQAMHLTWERHEKQTPHAVERLSELSALFDPPPDSVDAVTVWTDGATETGLAVVTHRLDGEQRVDSVDWPEGTPTPASTGELERSGWRQVTGPLHPKAIIDGVAVATGQVVEYWVRPVIDDFMLFRLVSTPGEAMSLRRIVPPNPEIVEFETEDEFRAFLPRGFACRCVSPVHPGHGLSGFETLD